MGGWDGPTETVAPYDGGGGEGRLAASVAMSGWRSDSWSAMQALCMGRAMVGAREPDGVHGRVSHPVRRSRWWWYSGRWWW